MRFFCAMTMFTWSLLNNLTQLKRSKVVTNSLPGTSVFFRIRTERNHLLKFFSITFYRFNFYITRRVIPTNSEHYSRIIICKQLSNTFVPTAFVFNWWSCRRHKLLFVLVARCVGNTFIANSLFKWCSFSYRKPCGAVTLSKADITICKYVINGFSTNSHFKWRTYSHLELCGVIIVAKTIHFRACYYEFSYRYTIRSFCPLWYQRSSESKCEQWVL